MPKVTKPTGGAQPALLDEVPRDGDATAPEVPTLAPGTTNDYALVAQANYDRWLQLNGKLGIFSFLAPYVFSGLATTSADQKTIHLSLNKIRNQTLVKDGQLYSFDQHGSNWQQLLETIWSIPAEVVALLDTAASTWDVSLLFNPAVLEPITSFLSDLLVSHHDRSNIAYGAQLIFDPNLPIEYIDDNFFSRAEQMPFDPQPGTLYLRESLKSGNPIDIDVGDFIGFYKPTIEDPRFNYSFPDSTELLTPFMTLTGRKGTDLTNTFLGMPTLDAVGQKNRGYTGSETYTISLLHSLRIQKEDRHFVFLPPANLENEVAIAPRPPRIKLDYPHFINAKDLITSLTSIDASVTVESIKPIKIDNDYSLDRRWKFIVHLQKDAKTVGDIMIDYVKNDDGTYDVCVNYQEKNHVNQFYITELISNLVRYHAKKPEIRNIHYAAHSRDRFAWRHFDGFKIQNEMLSNIKQRLLAWNKQFGWGLKPSDIKTAKTPLQVSKLIDLGGAYPALYSHTLEAYNGSPRPTARNLLRSQFPGELALMLGGQDQGIFLSLDTKNPEAYVSYLDSLIEFWKARAHKIERSTNMLQDLDVERGKYSRPTRSISTIYPRVSAAFTVSSPAAVAAKMASPPFIDKEALSRFIGPDIIISSTASTLKENGTYQLVCNLHGSDFSSAGTLSLSYKLEGEKWVLGDVCISLTDKFKNKFLGLHVATQLIRFHYHNPNISHWDARSFAKDVYWWRYFDGIQLGSKYFKAFKKELEKLLNLTRTPVSPDIINRITSPYLAVNGLELKEPNPLLEGVVRKFFPFDQADPVKTRERARYPGGLALLMAAKDSSKQGSLFEATMDLSHGSNDYRRFMASIIELWDQKIEWSDDYAKKAYVLELKNELGALKNEPDPIDPVAFRQSIIAQQADLIARSPFTPASFGVLPRLIH